MSDIDEGDDGSDYAIWEQQRKRELGMGMSTHVEGLKPPDETWQKMKAVWDACVEAKVNPPDAVQKFFDGVRPDPHGVIVDLNKAYPTCLEHIKSDSKDIWQVNIKRLPPDVTVIRFYNSY